MCVSLFLCRTERQDHILKNKTILTLIFYVNLLSFLHTNSKYSLLTLHSSNNLVGHVSDVVNGERLEVVFLEEIVCAEPKQLKSNTNVTVKVKPVQHMNTSA